MDTPERMTDPRAAPRLWEIPPALVAEIAGMAIDRYVEYRERYDRDPENARACAVGEVVEATGVDLDALEAELAGQLPAAPLAEELPC